MNRVRFPRTIGLVLRMIISPPLGFVSGVVGAVALYLVLGNVDLPAWARVGLAALAVPAVPGLWFLVMPILFGAASAQRLSEPPEYADWQGQQHEIFERHQHSFTRLGQEPPERVIADGRSITRGATRITLVALDLNAIGGCFSLVHHTADIDDPDAIVAGEFISSVSDDAGTEYVLQAYSTDVTHTGGRANVYFLLSPPPAATELHLTISHLVLLGDIELLAGPWDFTVRLR